MAPNRRNRRIQRYPRSSRSAAYRIHQPSQRGRRESNQQQSGLESQQIKGVHTQRLPPQPHDPVPEEQRSEAADQAQDASRADETAYTESQPEGADERQQEGSEQEEPPDDAELEEYVEKIEQAAARRRAEEQGKPLAAAPPRQRPAGGENAATHTERGQQVVRQSPPTRRSNRRRRPEQKPLLKRRKFWFIILAMIPLIAGIITVLYFANILRLSMLAYDDINEPRVTDRARWQINAAGTPEPVPTSEAGSVVANWSGEEPINVVLMGIDPRPNSDQPPRSDTVIVVRVDPAAESAVMMSIPRDVLVTIPGYGENKMNAAYPIGEANEEQITGGGPTLVAQTIEANFGIPIDYFATVNFEGFRNIIDTIGGVVVDVEAPLSDNLYPTEGLGVTRVYFPTGLQKLNGEMALKYVRTRHSDNDLERGNRQREVLMAIRNQALDLGLIGNAPDLIENMRDTVRTDLNFDQLVDLANLSRNIETEDIQQVNLWEAGVLREHFPEEPGDQYALIPDWPEVHELLSEHFDIQIGGSASGSNGDTGAATARATPTLAADFSVPVIVENATDIPQLAGNTAQMLAEAGFTAVWPSDADNLSEKTTIYNYVEETETAEHIARRLGLPESVIVQDTGGNGIVVQLGSDVPRELLPDEAGSP